MAAKKISFKDIETNVETFAVLLKNIWTELENFFFDPKLVYHFKFAGAEHLIAANDEITEFRRKNPKKHLLKKHIKAALSHCTTSPRTPEDESYFPVEWRTKSAVLVFIKGFFPIKGGHRVYVKSIALNDYLNDIQVETKDGNKVPLSDVMQSYLDSRFKLVVQKWPEIEINREKTLDKIFNHYRKQCAHCHIESSALKICADCEAVRYCGKVCQAKHWSHHKAECVNDAMVYAFLLSARNVPDIPPCQHCFQIVNKLP
jgi:hypothetical protein